MKQAPFLLKLCYCLTLFGLMVPMVLACLALTPVAADAAHLVPLVAGGGALVLLIAGLYRVSLVASVPGTLDAWPAGGIADALHKLGSAGVYAGAVVGLLNALAWLGSIEIAPLMAAAGGVGLVGLVLFELGRLLSFERRAREELSPQRLRPSPAIEGHSSLDRRKH